MPEVLAASLAFPCVIFTVILALALLYWLFVVLGALDLDLLGGAHGDVMPDLDGLAKGVLEGAAKGAAEGLAHAAHAAHPDGGVGVGDGGGAADDHGGIGELFSSLQLNRAPATVVLTLVTAFSWLISVLAMMTVEPLWAGWGLPHWLLAFAVLVVSIAVALPITAITVRPLGPLFATRAAQSRKDFIGRICVISTGRVDERFGQATLEDGGAGFILDVRCETPGALRQGDRALLVSWDPDKEAFAVEPMDALLGGRGGGGPRVAQEEVAPTAPAASAADEFTGREERAISTGARDRGR